jgi:hypothetical protein
VSGNGAYEDEMNEVALFQTALRALVPTQPDPRVGARLVPQLAEAARATTIEAETVATRRGAGVARRRPRSRLALVARVGFAVALIPLVLAGLAFAGVTVPEPARTAFDKVGITLPNQPSSDDHGTATKRSSDQPTGTTDTQAVGTETQSKGNSAAAHAHALAQREKARGKAVGHTRGKAIGLTGSTPPGQAKEPKESGPPAHSNAGGASATHTTTHTTPEPQSRPTPPGNANGHDK